jgi:uncharacterized protein
LRENDVLSDAALAEALSPKRFNLILLPTERCNFRCTYCYEDFAIGRMTPMIVSAVKRLLERRIPALDTLAVSWFGGEPLLAKDIVLDVGTFVHELCIKHGIKLLAHVTTNSYLLSAALLEELMRVSIREFQITLDGDQEWHDRTRVLANGGGTFEKLWTNLQSYRGVSGAFQIALRLHVHQDNVESMKRLYNRLQQELLHDPRFSAGFHKVSWLGPQPIKERVLGEREYLEALAYITGGSTAVERPDSGISEHHLTDYICYAAKPNSLMIRANGRIGKCTVAIDDERNDVGRLNDDGTLTIFQERLRKWFAGFANPTQESLGCPLSNLEPGAAPVTDVIVPMPKPRRSATSAGVPLA